MKKILYLLFLIANISVSAQHVDAPLQSRLTDSLHLQQGVIDSIAFGVKNKTKDIFTISPKLETQKLQLKNVDSIRSEMNNYNGKVNTLQKHLDSLSKLTISNPTLMHYRDSLKNKMDSLTSSGPTKEVRKIEQRLSGLQSGMNSKVKGFEEKVNNETGVLNTFGVKTPSLKTPDLTQYGVTTKIPDLNNVLKLNASELKVPALNGTELPSNGLSMPAFNVPGTQSLGSSLNMPGKLESETGELTKVTGEVGKVGNDVSKYDNLGKASGDIEKDIENSDAMKQLKAETLQAEQYKKMVEKWQSDPEYQKELIVNKAKDQVVNHFAEHDKELMVAMNKMSGIKSKYKNYEGALDMFKKPGNAMKGKPFKERLRLGFNLQIQSKHDVLIDVNPQIGYRVNGRLTAGIGWNERWGFDFDNRQYKSKDHIFGPRGYLQFKIKSGVYGIVAPEVMNTVVPPSFSSLDQGNRKWVWSYVAGMKKEFQYSKNLLGSLQVMYNLYDPKHQSPYINKLIIRMGFEFPMRKKAEKAQ